MVYFMYRYSFSCCFKIDTNRANKKIVVEENKIFFNFWDTKNNNSRIIIELAASSIFFFYFDKLLDLINYVVDII